MGPSDTGNPWAFLGITVALWAVVLAVAWRGCGPLRADGSPTPSTWDRWAANIDRYRQRAVSRFGRLAPAALALSVAVVGVAVASGLGVLLGRVTKLGAVIDADRPVYRFFLDRRADWLTTPLSKFTHIGEYQEMTALALAAALILGFNLRRMRVLTFVVLTGLFIWPFISLGKFYDYVDIVALVAFFVAAVVTRRPAWLSATVLMATMPLEKHLQAALNDAVHGSVPSIHTAVGGVGPFPSGGCTRTVLIFGLVAYLFAREYDSPRATRWLCAGAVSMAYLEGMTRIYLGKHWAVDCIGGWLYGAALLSVIIYSLRIVVGPVRPARETDSDGVRATPDDARSTR